MADKISAEVLNKTLRMLGIGSCDLEQEMINKISKTYSRLIEAASPKIISEIFNIENGEVSIVFNGAFAIQGKDLAELCRNCKHAVLMAVTLGAQVDRLIQRIQIEDMADAVIMDACASAEVENLCDMAEVDIMSSLPPDKFLTMRFSPGYGNVPLEESEKIITALFAAKKIGLSLTKNKLLVPMKSITAIIGISDKKESRAVSCELCGIKEVCIYKSRGGFCGIQDK